MNNSFISTINSFLGPLRLRWEGGRLAELSLPSSPPGHPYGEARINPGDDWCDILNLTGVDLAMGGHHAFSVQVWRWTMTIPLGRTRSYGWIAARIGNPGAARAVGRALGENPWSLLVPCHRVVRGDGTIGGFNSGLKWKRYLLKLERGDQGIGGSGYRGIRGSGDQEEGRQEIRGPVGEVSEDQGIRRSGDQEIRGSGEAELLPDNLIS